MHSGRGRQARPGSPRLDGVPTSRPAEVCVHSVISRRYDECIYAYRLVVCAESLP